MKMTRKQLAALDDEHLITVGVAAELLSVSTRTIRNWGHQQLVAIVVLPGGHHRVRLGDIRQILSPRAVSA